MATVVATLVWASGPKMLTGLAKLVGGAARLQTQIGL